MFIVTRVKHGGCSTSGESLKRTGGLKSTNWALNVEPSTLWPKPYASRFESLRPLTAGGVPRRGFVLLDCCVEPMKNHLKRAPKYTASMVAGCWRQGYKTLE